jgi:hypothetical protein
MTPVGVPVEPIGAIAGDVPLADRRGIPVRRRAGCTTTSTSHAASTSR